MHFLQIHLMVAISALAITANASPQSSFLHSKRVLAEPDYEPLKKKCLAGPSGTFVAVKYGFPASEILTFQYNECISANLGGSTVELIYFCHGGLCDAHKDEKCKGKLLVMEYKVDAGDKFTNLLDVGQVEFGSSIICSKPK